MNLPVILDSENLRKYLLSKGWQRDELSEAFQHIVAFSNPKYPQRQLQLPVGNHYADRRESNSLVVRKLAEIEERPESEIIEDLNRPSAAERKIKIAKSPRKQKRSKGQAIQIKDIKTIINPLLQFKHLGLSSKVTEQV